MKNSDIKIEGVPKESFYDKPLEIRIHNLPHEKAAKLTLDSDSKSYGSSEAVYKSNKEGKIDLTEQKPIDGDYDGIKPMGLFQFRPEKKQSKVEDNDSNKTPNSEDFQLTLEIDGNNIAKKEFKRIIKADHVERVEVKENKLEGVLFKPTGDPPYPAVIVLGGSGGRCPTGIQTKLLASRGYAVLALAIYGSGDLPDELMGVPLEYFEKAVSWMKSKDHIKNKPIGVMGGSKGGELALLLGSHIEEIQTVIAYSPSGVVFQGISQSFGEPTSSWSYDNEPIDYVDLPFLPIISMYLKYLFLKKPIQWEKIYSKGFNSSDSETIKESTIPVEKIGGSILLISGGDDKMWNANQLSKISVKRLKKNNYPHPYKHLNFEKAGHVFMAPFTPITGRDLVNEGKWKIGGKPEGFSKGDRKSWKYALKFLEKGLKNTSEKGG
ncbi:MAG: acyl-CoA thioester hydrolase/BAAT C-terminal domain-containing protein [Candidatus Saliniplasma sp.]